MDEREPCPWCATPIPSNGEHDSYDCGVVLKNQRDTLRADVVLAAGELLVPIPEPGTDAARLMLANVMMRRERDAATREAADLRAVVEAVKR